MDHGPFDFLYEFMFDFMPDFLLPDFEICKFAYLLFGMSITCKMTETKEKLLVKLNMYIIINQNIILKLNLEEYTL